MFRTVMLGMVAGALTLSAAGVAAQHGGKDVVDTAVAAGSFKTLAIALEGADLVDTLKGKGPYTVFAPTDKALAKLPASTRGGAAVAEIFGDFAWKRASGTTRICRSSRASRASGSRI